MTSPAILLFTLFLSFQGPTPPRAKLVAQGRRALRTNDLPSAITAARQLIARFPNDAVGHYLLGLAASRDARPSDAVRAFTRAVELQPDSAVIRFNLAGAQFESNHPRTAEETYLNVATLDPGVAPLALLDAGFAASAAGRLDAAERHLRDALKLAPARNHRLQEKADRLLEEIGEHRESEATATVARLVHEGKMAMRSGHRELAARRLLEAEALAETVRPSEIETELQELSKEIANTPAPSRQRRVSVEVSVAGAYDTNVARSDTVPVIPNQAQLSAPASPLLAVDFDLLWRPVGTVLSGLSFRYHVSQLGYLTEPADVFSVQAHTLGVVGRWSPHPRITLEADAQALLLMTGLRYFGLFEVGGDVGPRIVLREGRGFELRGQYQHTFQRALGYGPDYLTGSRDHAAVSQSFRNDTLRLALSYVFHSDALGIEDVALSDLALPMAYGTRFGDNPVYHVSWAYRSHGASLEASFHLPWLLRLSAKFRYEHRFYADSFITDAGGKDYGHRLRDDDRYVAEASLRRDLPLGFGIGLAYTLVVNRSNVDFTNSKTPYDWDNLNYQKHVALLQFSYLY